MESSKAIFENIIARAGELADKNKPELIRYVGDDEEPLYSVRKWTRGELISWILEHEFSALFPQFPETDY